MNEHTPRFPLLNEEQRAAVECRASRVVVNACAGSGKTATAATKVAGWVGRGIPPRDILMLTFTRKAAREMQSRLAKLLGDDECRVDGGTYHSVALRQMRRAPHIFGLPESFSVSDDSGTEQIWKKALKSSGVDPKNARVAAAQHSLAVNLRKDPSALFRHCYGEGWAKACEIFRNTKKQNAALDYDDILSLWFDALDGGAFPSKWTHVMVDEFQDNSELQYDILKKLDPVESFLVGDPNQCIYSFRGSAPNLMKRFASDHPDAKEFFLSLNYRCGETILGEANSAIGTGPALRNPEGRGGRVQKVRFRDPGEEAGFVTRKIAAMLADGGEPKDIAVLFRSGYQSVPLEMSLRQNRIPYKKYGGASLTEAADIRDFLAMLRAWHNGQDRMAKLRVSMLFPGVGEKTAEKSLGGDGCPWPAKAKEAGVWIEAAEREGWPGGAEILCERLGPLFFLNYPEDAEGRTERVAELARSGREFGNLGDFLDHYTVGDEDRDSHPKDCITISTIHSAKGLEWDSVFLCGAGGLQLPSRKAAERGEVDEERRLFYVAATRAKNYLCLTYPEQTGRGEWQTPTPFSPRDGWMDGSMPEGWL